MPYFHTTRCLLPFLTKWILSGKWMGTYLHIHIDTYAHKSAYIEDFFVASRNPTIDTLIQQNTRSSKCSNVQSFEEEKSHFHSLKSIENSWTTDIPETWFMQKQYRNNTCDSLLFTHHSSLRNAMELSNLFLRSRQFFCKFTIIRVEVINATWNFVSYLIHCAWCPRSQSESHETESVIIGITGVSACGNKQIKIYSPSFDILSR